MRRCWGLEQGKQVGDSWRKGGYLFIKKRRLVNPYQKKGGTRPELALQPGLGQGARISDQNKESANIIRPGKKSNLSGSHQW